MQNRHTTYDLKQMQSVPLEGKILMTKRRIQEWVDAFGTDGVYVSFSGGKDSTVLKHIVDSMYNDIPAVFVNTGLEYPEIQRFVREIKSGKYDCFNSDVVMLRPEMRFDEVIKKYGYPVISKTVSNKVETAKPNNTRWLQLKGQFVNPINGEYSQYNIPQWAFLLDAPFKISDKCCAFMKKAPVKKFNKETDKKPILGLMAEESKARYDAWIKTGCNAFELKNPQSQPMAFWTEQDVLHYIKKFNVPYCSVYGDIVLKQVPDGDLVLDGQINLIDYLQCHEPEDHLMTTGCSRTGCIFCMFGCHLEKEPNRFQRLKETHPKQYKYCIGGGEYNEEGKWQPNKEGLGLGHVLEYIGVKYD